jgi:predicted metal-dependent HD superfamily phosphohydrolase
MRFATIERFSEVCLAAGQSSAFTTCAWSELHSRYSESHRRYHTLSHIDQMLAWFDVTGAPPLDLELSIWYHDVVYDPQGSENELRSADLFARQFEGYVSDELCADVRRLILATDHRRDRTLMADESLLIDIDLSILAAPEDEYDRYSSAIRQEYAFVPSDSYCRGRSAVMSKFLSQPIFSNELFASMEATARANIQRELEQLQSEMEGTPSKR